MNFYLQDIHTTIVTITTKTFIERTNKNKKKKKKKWQQESGSESIKKNKLHEQRTHSPSKFIKTKSILKTLSTDYVPYTQIHIHLHTQTYTQRFL